MLSLLLPYAIAIFVVLATLLALLLYSYRAVRPGTALVVFDRRGKGRVLLDGGTWMLPFSGSTESILILPRDVALRFDGADALASDGKRASFVLHATLRVDPTHAGVRSVVETIGAPRANDPSAVAELARRVVAPELARALAATRADAPLDAVADALARATPGSFAGFVVDDVVVRDLALASA
ncbi:MAG TPA: hypothetical protein VL400_23210 [Polyangiaceae bacterium]|jgi:uncharacterized membrane protein YqiK|nr:hypothetical protein [Polyangiaceae bacterium]